MASSNLASSSMASANTDTGILELDKLIHSLEFENQQYVKMIEKENQLISSLESQIEEKNQEILRLDQDISRIDEDTRQLHRLYTNNADNIDSLRNTISVLSEHAAALSRQLEIARNKTEDSRQFYESQLATYSGIRDNYMRKYSSFPLAVELDKKKQSLAVVQRRYDDIKAAKQDLEMRIASVECELDSKILTRIVIKISQTLSARTKLATVHLRKEVENRLAEKTDLAEKLKDIRTSKQTAQGEQGAENNEHSGQTLSMETDDPVNVDDSDRQNTSNEIEGFSCMTIADDLHGSINEEEQHLFPNSDTEDLPLKDRQDSHCPGDRTNTAPGNRQQEMSLESVPSQSASVLASGGDISFQGSTKPNSSTASDQTHMETFAAELTTEGPSARHVDELLMSPLVQTAKMCFSLPSQIPPLPTTDIRVIQKLGRVSQQKLVMPSTHIRAIENLGKVPEQKLVLPSTPVQAIQNVDKVHEQRMAPDFDTGMKKTPKDMTASNTQVPSSGERSKAYIPQLSRVLTVPSTPISPVQNQARLSEQSKTSCSEVKKATPNPASMLKDFRQKMSLLVPKATTLLAPNLQNQQNTWMQTAHLTPAREETAQGAHHPLSLPTPTRAETVQGAHHPLSHPTPTRTETVQGACHPLPHLSSTVQVAQPQSLLSHLTTETETPKSVSDIINPLAANHGKPLYENKKPTVEKQYTPLQEIVEAKSKPEFSASASIRTTDVEVPTKGSDSPPSESDSHQKLFSVHIQGFNSTSLSTRSPKGKYSTSTNRKNPTTDGHGFLFESLFGKFEKKFSDDAYESDEEAAPTSLFNIFLSQNPVNKNADDSKEPGSFFKLGKFTEDEGSPTSGGPSSLLNLFTRSQISDNSSHEFAMAIQDDGDEKESDTSTFKLGVVASGEGSASDDEAEKPLFHLF